MNNIKTLSNMLGLSDSYIDKMGNIHKTKKDTRLTFLSEFSSEEINEIESSINPKTLSFFKSDKAEIIITLPFKTINNVIRYDFFKDNKKLSSHIVRKYEIIKSSKIAQQVKFNIKFPKDFGYYDLVVSTSSFSHTFFVIYAPDFAYFPHDIERKRGKLLGIGLQLYALRSKNDMGVGDFSSLEKFIKHIAPLGCDFIGLNPLGAMYKDSSADVSPYRTLSREYLNYLYLDLKKELDFKKSIDVQKYLSTKSYMSKVKKLQASNIVDYKETLNLKHKILSLMFKHFKLYELEKNTKRAKLFNKFKDNSDLINLCLFETLLEKNDSFWGNWDAMLKHPSQELLSKLKNKYKDKINFYAYCHWLCDIQLKRLQILCKKLKMKIGLYLDIPTGAASNGCEVWQHQDFFALQMDIGTPPDTIRPKGQTWGLTPLKPSKIKNDYTIFINLVRNTMKYAGAIRIDHAFGLQRLFWVNSKGQGAYVNYSMKDFTAILTLESHKNNCIVIGEDLGNTPPGFREFMATHKILSNKILFRQKDADGEFLSTSQYPYFSLSQVSTHDQATSCGFWIAEDINANQSCNLYPKESQYKNSLLQREKEKNAFIKALKKEKCFVDNEELFAFCKDNTCIPENLPLSFNKYGIKTKSALYLIRIEDIIGQTLMQNVPSTVDEYPNWRIKLPFYVEDLGKFDIIKPFVKELKRT